MSTMLHNNSMLEPHLKDNRFPVPIGAVHARSVREAGYYSFRVQTFVTMQLRVVIRHSKALLNRVRVKVLQLSITKLLRQNMQRFVFVWKAFIICLGQEKYYF